MKKTLLLLTIFTTMLFSCKKEEESSLNQPLCNCGIITNDGIDTQSNCYWLEIQNNCSGNKAQFCFEYSVWMNNYVGNKMCVSNVSNW